MQNKHPDVGTLPDNLLAMSQRIANIRVKRAVDEMRLASSRASFGDRRAQELIDAQHYEALINAEIDRRKAAGKYKPESSRVSQLIADSGQIGASQPDYAKTGSTPYPGLKVTVAYGYGNGTNARVNSTQRPLKVMDGQVGARRK